MGALLLTLAVTTIYFATAKLSLLWAFVEGNVTPVWIPSGVALAAVLRYGGRAWPGLALGAFLATYSTGAPLSFALVTGLGNPLAALLGALLLQRLHFQPQLARVRDVLGLIGLAGALATTVSASIGVAGLCHSGLAPWSAYASIWWVWWLGDAMGVLLIAPLLLVWHTSPWPRLHNRLHLLEAGLLFSLLLALSQLVFSDLLNPSLNAPLIYLSFPLLIWAAMRFGQQGAVSAVTLLAAIATWHTAHHAGPFAATTINLSLVLAYLFLFIVATTAMLLAAEVTERRQAERALRASEYQRRRAETAAQIMVAHVDTAGRWLNIPSALSALLGYAEQELTGQPMTVIVHPGDRATFEQQQQRLLAQQISACELEKRCLGRDGSVFWLYFNGALVYDHAGQPLHFLVYIRDNTRRKHIEEDREHLINALAAKNTELERFTYTVSHDLKSPLITIQGFLTLLDKDMAAGAETRVREDMQHIRTAAERMHQLLDDLLELSRVGRLTHDLQPVALDGLVAEITGLLARRLDENGIALRIVPNLPTVQGDRKRLLQVMENLLDNAIKFMGAQPTPQISIGAEQMAGEVVCYVRDNGSGIAAPEQERVFELFERLNDSVTGTGIGLALVKRIVEAHGGRVWLESAGVGQGSTFYFTLPPALPVSRRPTPQHPVAAEAN